MHHPPELAHTEPELGVQHVVPDPLDLPGRGRSIPNLEPVRPAAVYLLDGRGVLPVVGHKHFKIKKKLYSTHS
jgi:hypothetical protein